VLGAELAALAQSGIRDETRRSLAQQLISKSEFKFRVKVDSSIFCHLSLARPWVGTTNILSVGQIFQLPSRLCHTLPKQIFSALSSVGAGGLFDDAMASRGHETAETGHTLIQIVAPTISGFMKVMAAQIRFPTRATHHHISASLPAGIDTSIERAALERRQMENRARA
jgi:hypothetical protein